MINTNFPWSAKLDWHDANFDLTVVCNNRQQIRCHKSILAAASPFISFLLKEEQPDAVLVLDEVEAVHLRSLLSLLYHGWADAESTGGLIQLWKQLGITVVRLAPPNIQVVKESSINVTDDMFMQTRSTKENSAQDTTKESEKKTLYVHESNVNKKPIIEEVEREELGELVKEGEIKIKHFEKEEFKEFEKGRVLKVKPGTKKEGTRRLAEEEVTATKKRERPSLLSKAEALTKKKKTEVILNNLEGREKEVLRIEQVKSESEK